MADSHWRVVATVGAMASLAFEIAFFIRAGFDIGILVYLGASGQVPISVLWVIFCSLSPNQPLQTLNNGKIPKSISWQQL
ncbi:hypothetical protein [Limnofasciculus baicalensis]|uniref:Uncharacterized protein n=1 Tax=Limnofasciculus baicalensis BBK-W-15 TaxID=2699891 RepID=A0AAE3GUL8_9CYAN|nr:hypothetical protein [Limnofasciculus baicalensis]MCP2730759.1 hypothetical protein [Limnofasciculus baicalensis BBK-W-15]